MVENTAPEQHGAKIEVTNVSVDPNDDQMLVVDAVVSLPVNQSFVAYSSGRYSSKHLNQSNTPKGVKRDTE